MRDSKQRHYFANKGPSSQGYGFSSGHVWMWVQFSHSVMSNSLQPHGLQHARHPCPSPTPGVYSNSCPLSQWCHPTISSSVVAFFSLLQSFPASGSFPMSRFFTSGSQSIGASASASVLPMNKYSGLISFRMDWLDLLVAQGTVWFHHFVENRRAKSGSSDRFSFLGLQNHCRWWLQPRN